MSDLFKDQIAVVTGGASGLGLAIARKLHTEVGRVAMLDINPATQATKDVGENAHIFACDVTNEAHVSAVIAQIVERFGRIDILVNSAGITGKTNVKTHEVELSNFRLVFDINVIGSFLTSRAVLPYMLERNYGRILREFHNRIHFRHDRRKGDLLTGQ
jgi:2-dehydro-3-deoxy-L-rhamnonate dehydrogenase (NAD+)